jgi:hypothetical protein
MSLRKILLFVCLLGAWFCRAQVNEVQPRILLVLDRSSSMINLWDGGVQKAKVSNEFVLRLMDSIYRVNPEVEFSLRVFGSQSTVDQNDCRDTKNELPFRKDNRLQMEYRLDDIQPLGVTSIAYALMQAADNDLVDVAHNAYSIILITDGGESCGGDICEVMRRLARDKVFFKPYIVNLESSATVRASYACLGDYLEVTRRVDIPAAVSKIVNAFRPVITINDKQYTKVKEVAATSPTVLNVKIPDVKMKDTVVAMPSIDKLAVKPSLAAIAKPELPKASSAAVPPATPYVEGMDKDDAVAVNNAVPAAMKRLVAEIVNPYFPKPTSVPPFTPTIVEERPEPETIARLVPATMKQTRIDRSALPNPGGARTLPAYVPVFIFERPAAETFPKLQLAWKKISTINVVDGGGAIMNLRRLPPMPAYKSEALPVAKTTPAPKPAGVGKPLPGKEAEFKVETEDAEQTTVQVYFTNGHGKFYSSTPQIMLLDPVTGNLVKRFYRMVNEAGEPDPQTNIPPGHYNLTFSETRSLVVNNVAVEENKHNKIVITVNKASLSFEYAGAENRPVKEFIATVTQRNRANGTITNQRCDEKLTYEPENYHVEINTFPRDIRNLDLDFDEKVIRIPQPGFAKFVSPEGAKSVTLYEQFGDKYRAFHTFPVSDPVLNHLQIQPGKYEAHFHMEGPPGLPEKVVVFFIKPTQETVVELKP